MNPRNQSVACKRDISLSHIFRPSTLKKRNQIVVGTTIYEASECRSKKLIKCRSRNESKYFKLLSELNLAQP